jgi:AcrR family transcriptional regulator
MISATATPRGRLMAAARELLGAGEVDGVTLRAIARCAGVSHGAPLKHFPHRAALLSAVAAAGFEDLAEAGRRSREACGPGTPAGRRLVASARAYVRFGIENPGMFALMFRRDLLDQDDAELTRASLGAFDQLLAVVRERQAEGWRRDEDAHQLAGVFMSFLHGFTQLWIWGTLPIAVRSDSLDAALATALRTFDLDLDPDGEPGT